MPTQDSSSATAQDLTPGQIAAGLAIEGGKYALQAAGYVIDALDPRNREPIVKELQSSHLASMIWRPPSGPLTVQFKNGSSYSYSADRETAQGLAEADSPGSYLWTHLRGREVGNRGAGMPGRSRK